MIGLNQNPQTMKQDIITFIFKGYSMVHLCYFLTFIFMTVFIGKATTSFLFLGAVAFSGIVTFLLIRSNYKNKTFIKSAPPAVFALIVVPFSFFIILTMTNLSIFTLRYFILNFDKLGYVVDLISRI